MTSGRQGWVVPEVSVVPNRLGSALYLHQVADFVLAPVSKGATILKQGLENQ